MPCGLRCWADISLQIIPWQLLLVQHPDNQDPVSGFLVKYTVAGMEKLQISRAQIADVVADIWKYREIFKGCVEVKNISLGARQPPMFYRFRDDMPEVSVGSRG